MGASNNSQKLVVVLGAGVVGLHSALALLEAGYEVAIIAKHLPGDLDVGYCSPWSASTWATNPTLDDQELQRWYMEAYQLWGKIYQEEGDYAGVSERTYYSYLENLPDRKLLEKGAGAFWYSERVRNFRVLSPKELIAGGQGAKWGYAFTSFAINAPKYLQYLRKRIVGLGGVIIRSSLPTGIGLTEVLRAATTVLEDNLPKPRIFGFVLATGMGTKDLIGDNDIFPMKSQSVYVKGEAYKVADRLEVGSVAGDDHEVLEDVPGIPIYYGSPRVGAGYTVLGGFMDEGNWSEELNPLVTQKLLEKNRKLFPELLNENGEFTFISEQLGMRPHRVGGIRLEVEYVREAKKSEATAATPVVHNYGHSHGGFIKAIGSSRKVVELINGANLQITGTPWLSN